MVQINHKLITFCNISLSNYITMPTQKKKKPIKSNNTFRKQQKCGMVTKDYINNGSNPNTDTYTYTYADADDYSDLFTDHEFDANMAEDNTKDAEVEAINKLLVEAENAELIANMPHRADRNKNRHPIKVHSEWNRVDHPGEEWPKTMHRGGGQMFGRPEQPTEPETPPDCPICTEVLNDNYVTTSCRHTFHKNCLREWCQQRLEETECPLCRRTIGPICRELLFTELEKLLFHAINIGEIDFAETVLANSINADGTPKKDDNNTLLLDINVKNKDGDTPLILAAINDQVEIVDMLLKFGADVDELNDDGYSAFRVTDNDEIINLLITFGTEHYDPTDDAVEASIFGFGNRGGKKSKKTRKKYKTKR
jgi:hypothetical protein